MAVGRFPLAAWRSRAERFVTMKIRFVSTDSHGGRRRVAARRALLGAFLLTWFSALPLPAGDPVRERCSWPFLDAPRPAAARPDAASAPPNEELDAAAERWRSGRRRGAFVLLGSLAVATVIIGVARRSAARHRRP